MEELLKRICVDKSKARLGDLARVPRHISEYLLTKFEGDTIKASNFIAKYCPPRSESNVILHRVMNGEAVIIFDEVQAEPIPKLGIYLVRFSNLDLGEVYTISKVIKNTLSVLRHGAWGTVKLAYDAEGALTGRPAVLMVGFSPLETTEVNLDELTSLRRRMGLEEWINLLMNTCGMNPDYFSPRQRIIYLARLLPLIEENLHILELGPRATGKTYIYRNLSRYTRIFSGGGVSSAVLFYNAAYKIPGELAVRDCVIFDEISRIEFPDPHEVTGKLKDYLESGMYERGTARLIRSGCSLVMQGNIDRDHDAWDRVLPKNLREPALIDRIAGLLPGWELPKITTDALSNGIGISADYFSEYMHALRSFSFSKIIADSVEIGGRPSIRDERAVVKLASAMYKLLRPDGDYDKEVLELSLNFAVEMRNRIRRKLHQMIPSEFPEEPLTWRYR